MDTRRYAFPSILRVGLPPFPTVAAASLARAPIDPVSRYCLIAPLLRRELDQLRGRLGTPAEHWNDRERLDAMSRRLADLIRATFT